jgi:hypothetical protein
MMELMRDYFWGTDLDMSQDIGAALRMSAAGVP